MTLSVYMSQPRFDLDQNEIKKAVKAIINGRIKPEHINSLEVALCHPVTDDKVWNKILDGRGASKAYEDKIYSEPMVRLLTLKALLIPKFLPDFLIWMQTAPKPDDCWESCQKLQALILKECKKSTTGLPYLTRNINDGIYRLLSRLIKKPKSSQSGNQIKRKLLGFVHSKFDIPQLFKATQSLLTENQGLWSQVYRKPFTEDFETVLGQMKDCREPGLPEYSSEEQQKFFKSLERFWRSPRQTDKTDKQYLILAQLFEEVGSPKFAAIFYQISIGEVPKKVFKKVSRNDTEDNLYGMTIYPKMNLADYAKWVLYSGLDFFDRRSQWILVIFLSLFIPLSLFWLYQTSSETSPTPPNPESTPTPPPTPTPLSNDNQKLFDRTNEAVNAMIDNLTDEIDKLPTDTLKKIGIPESVYDNKDYIAKFCIKKVLPLSSDFQYSQIGTDNQTWETFSEALKKYQTSKGATNPDGVIDVNGKTPTWLEDDIRNRCLNPNGG